MCGLTLRNRRQDVFSVFETREVGSDFLNRCTGFAGSEFGSGGCHPAGKRLDIHQKSQRVVRRAGFFVRCGLSGLAEIEAEGSIL